MTSPTTDAAQGAPNCWQCRHFAVSWDPQLPYACRLMGFKSRVVPSIEVLRADGSRCRGFIARPATDSAVPSAETPAEPSVASSPLGRYSTFSKLA